MYLKRHFCINDMYGRIKKLKTVGPAETYSFGVGLETGVSGEFLLLCNLPSSCVLYHSLILAVKKAQ